MVVKKSRKKRIAVILLIVAVALLICSFCINVGISNLKNVKDQNLQTGNLGAGAALVVESNSDIGIGGENEE